MRNPETRAKSRAKWKQSPKGVATLRAARKRRHEQEQKQAKAEKARLREVPCPHCGAALVLPGNSTFVLRKEDVGEAFKPEDYHPNPTREYKTPEANRRRQLAYYWRNRERVLAREKAKRLSL